MMKKFVSVLMSLCLVCMPVMALAIARAIPDESTPVPTATPEPVVFMELSDWLGKPEAECKAVLPSGSTMSNRLVFDKTEDGLIKGIILREGAFSIFGLCAGGTFDKEWMISDGWENISSWYEGGVLDHTFKKTVGDAEYTFRIWEDTNPYTDVITYMNLKVSDPAAHIANVEAGASFMVPQTAE